MLGVLHKADGRTALSGARKGGCANSKTHTACRSDLSSGTTAWEKISTMYDVYLLLRKVVLVSGLVGSSIIAEGIDWQGRKSRGN